MTTEAVSGDTDGPSIARRATRHVGSDRRRCSVTGSRHGTGGVRGDDRAVPPRGDAVVAGADAGRTRGAERAARRAGRRGLRPAGLLRLGSRHPDLRPSRRRRAPLRQLPHHGSVLADPGLPAHRPQPPLGGHGPHRGAGHRLPGLRRPHPALLRDAARRAGARGLRGLGHRQVAPDARGRVARGGVPGPLAAGAGLRALLRLLRRGGPPVRPGPGLGQPPDPATPVLRGRVPPHRGPGRPCDRLRP